MDPAGGVAPPEALQAHLGVPHTFLDGHGPPTGSTGPAVFFESSIDISPLPSTEGGESVCASLQARENTRTTALFDTLNAFSKREAAGMETPCPRPGKP